MNEVEEDRKKKQNLINRKHELQNNLKNLIKNNLQSIKNILYLYKTEQMELPTSWAFDLVNTNLQNWIFECETNLKNIFIKNCIFLEELPDCKNENKTNDFYTALVYYFMLKERLNYKVTFNKTDFYIYYNLNTGELKTENFLFSINKSKSNDSNELFYKNFIINSSLEEVEKRKSFLKFEISFFEIKKIENRDEKYLKKFISYEYMKDKNIVPVLNLNKTAIESILLYVNEILKREISVFKKTLLVNILLILYPEIKKSLDISYFKKYKEYYFLKWIEFND